MSESLLTSPFCPYCIFPNEVCVVCAPSAMLLPVSDLVEEEWREQSGFKQLSNNLQFGVFIEY